VSAFFVVSGAILLVVSGAILLVVSGATVVAVSAVLFSLSPLLLQAVIKPAIARVAKIFFIVFGLMFKNFAKIMGIRKFNAKQGFYIIIFF
jgi:hypothetical protein